MDTGEGRFDIVDPETIRQIMERKNSSKETGRTASIFHEDEVVSVKGSRFQVQRITPKKLILKLLPWESNKALERDRADTPVDDAKPGE